jgi:hypothetical protein
MPEPVEQPPALTDFTPVPRLHLRSDGWSPEVQRSFIEWLADLASVTEACRMVGRSTTSAYRLKRHPEAGEFAVAWDAALRFAVGHIEDGAIDRAANGVEVPVFAYGDKIATRRVFNDRLVMFMLRTHAPDRYCEGGARAMSAIDKRVLERMKKEWRAEWEAEERENEQETLDSIDAYLETMRHNRQSNMSPAQRAHEIAACAQALADREAGWRAGGAYREYAAKAAELLPRFIAEVEKEWPELPDWAWDEPDEEEEDPAPALPPPDRGQREEAEPEPPSGPRVRTLRDDGW